MTSRFPRSRYKYVHHAGDTAILDEQVASYYDPVKRTVSSPANISLNTPPCMTFC